MESKTCSVVWLWFFFQRETDFINCSLMSRLASSHKNANVTTNFVKMAMMPTTSWVEWNSRFWRSFVKLVKTQTAWRKWRFWRICSNFSKEAKFACRKLRPCCVVMSNVDGFWTPLMQITSPETGLICSRIWQFWLFKQITSWVAFFSHYESLKMCPMETMKNLSKMETAPETWI